MAGWPPIELAVWLLGRAADTFCVCTVHREEEHVCPSVGKRLPLKKGNPFTAAGILEWQPISLPQQ
jgi:hypothetical protein